MQEGLVAQEGILAEGYTLAVLVGNFAVLEDTPVEEGNHAGVVAQVEHIHCWQILKR